MAAWTAAPPSVGADDVVVETLKIELRINDLRAALAGTTAGAPCERATIRRLEDEIQALASRATRLRADAGGMREPARVARW